MISNRVIFHEITYSGSTVKKKKEIERKIKLLVKSRRCHAETMFWAGHISQQAKCYLPILRFIKLAKCQLSQKGLMKQ